MQNKLGDTPLHNAAWKGSEEVRSVRKLKECLVVCYLQALASEQSDSSFALAQLLLGRHGSASKHFLFCFCSPC